MTMKPEWIWQCRERAVQIGARPLVMGILNVTPDSFADGGRYADTDQAVARALQMAQDGAAILDIGGESTRPGAEPVSTEEELHRVLPVVQALSRLTPALLSVDTRKARVAEQALLAGAHIVNDISALRHDPRMAEVARAAGAGVILMHMQGEPRTMQDHPQYTDVVREVAAFLDVRLQEAERRGLTAQALAVDPGIGFGKTAQHNLRLLTHLPAIGRLGRPVVVGLSRKRFIGAVTGRPVQDRLPGSLAALCWCCVRGAQIVRVHDVRESVDAVNVTMALLQESTS
jgi:dihydropteroate synthase